MSSPSAGPVAPGVGGVEEEAMGEAEEVIEEPVKVVSPELDVDPIVVDTKVAVVSVPDVPVVGICVEPMQSQADTHSCKAGEM